ncbi:hypothetical protein BJ741DRAFT_662447 [Chytriomyces cf. hyalinus JEL632]|nr:hypothetical protein BJ741DRAFT_662447 [Chytriomyces cf. hyalinus JEL632]
MRNRAKNSNAEGSVLGKMEAAARLAVIRMRALYALLCRLFWVVRAAVWRFLTGRSGRSAKDRDESEKVREVEKAGTHAGQEEKEESEVEVEMDGMEEEEGKEEGEEMDESLLRLALSSETLAWTEDSDTRVAQKHVSLRRASDPDASHTRTNSVAHIARSHTCHNFAALQKNALKKANKIVVEDSFEFPKANSLEYAVTPTNSPRFLMDSDIALDTTPGPCTSELFVVSSSLRVCEATWNVEQNSQVDISEAVAGFTFDSESESGVSDHGCNVSLEPTEENDSSAVIVKESWTTHEHSGSAWSLQNQPESVVHVEDNDEEGERSFSEFHECIDWGDAAVLTAGLESITTNVQESGLCSHTDTLYP